MPDIAMCTDKECPSRVHCYRYIAKPSERQSYAEFKHDSERCQFYESTSVWDDRFLSNMKEIEGEE